jgi:hypothetical protein
VKILLSLEREKLKHEVIFETNPDDHVIIHEFNLAVVDLQRDKEWGKTSPGWKLNKLHHWQALMFRRFARHVPGTGWTLTNYQWLDYP